MKSLSLILILTLFSVGCASIPQEKQDEFIQTCSGNAICIVKLEDAYLEKLKEEREYKLVEYQQEYRELKVACLARGNFIYMDYATPCLHRRSACLPKRLTDTFYCMRRF